MKQYTALSVAFEILHFIASSIRCFEVIIDASGDGEL